MLDKILPPNIKEFLGKEITLTNGEQSAGDEGTQPGEEGEPTAEDPTKDWKTYESSLYGYTIKYPEDWVASQNTAPSAETERFTGDEELVLTSPQGAVVDVEAYTHNYGSIEAFMQDQIPQVIVGRLRKIEISGKTSFLDQGDDEGAALWVEISSIRILFFRYSGCGAFGCPTGVSREAEKEIYDMMLGTISIAE